MDATAELTNFGRTAEFFVGVDSDGCVFDTMELKQKECFCPSFIARFGLQAVARLARETWEFVNLHGASRGCNRFMAVRAALHLLRERPGCRQRGVAVPETVDIEAWLASATTLGNASLAARVAATGSAELATLLAWSEEVNARIADMVHGVPPFPGVRASLERLCAVADVIVVSQTPVEALRREWHEHAIAGLVRVIAGQEAGTKAQHIALASAGRYAPERMLMIGDAPGDLRAAQANNALFFPIMPGDETASWEQFRNEGCERFLDGTFGGAYQERLVDAFVRALPATPPWARG